MRSPEANRVLVGNFYDKYATKNPFARWLMNGFLGAVTDLYEQIAPKSVLEVGCGEGLLAQHLVSRGPQPERFEACDIELGQLAPNLNPLIRFSSASIYALPWEDACFDLVVCCEVLEHLDDPARGLREIARVSRRAVLVSTPREPLWRLLNVARGSYWRALGNTPGHVQHFSRRSLERLVSQSLEIQRTRSPVPWTVLLAAPRRNAS